MYPYVTRVLENPNNWMITTMGLLLRSRLECNKSRTVERSCLQLQALVDQWKLLDNDANFFERLDYFFFLLIPSKWELEKELGERYISIGVIRSSLEIFYRLEMWEMVINCHQMLEEPAKAEQVIMKQLENNPDSHKFYYLLASVKGDPELYLKSWKLSQNRYPRAMRSLGALYYSRNQFKESIEAYQNALKINPLFENSWFVMGCAAMKIEEYETAIEAFAKCTNIDNQNGEAYNNLASAQIKLKQL
jgi:tetratricopeptide (TPR) repeat protein